MAIKISPLSESDIGVICPPFTPINFESKFDYSPMQLYPNRLSKIESGTTAQILKLIHHRPPQANNFLIPEEMWQTDGYLITVNIRNKKLNTELAHSRRVSPIGVVQTKEFRNKQTALVWLCYLGQPSLLEKAEASFNFKNLYETPKTAFEMSSLNQQYEQIDRQFLETSIAHFPFNNLKDPARTAFNVLSNLHKKAGGRLFTTQNTISYLLQYPVKVKKCSIRYRDHAIKIGKYRAA